MRDYLSHEFDPEDFDLVSVIDELPLWSAPFGLSLLDTIMLAPGMRVLDVGCGLGFPLVEISRRLGGSGRVYGIDPWERAVERVRLKLRTYAIGNVEIATGVAESLPFEDEFFDLITSNNGITNVEDIDRSLAECRRVAKPGAQFVLTFNLPDTMIEFYTAFRAVLAERGMPDAVTRINEHIRAKRPTAAEMEARLAKAGFDVRETRPDTFKLRFLDAETMFDHYLIKYWFLPPWKELVPESERDPVFAAVEARLNETTVDRGGIELSVPFVTIDCRGSQA